MRSANQDGEKSAWPKPAETAPDKLFSPHGLSTIDMMMNDRIGGRDTRCVYTQQCLYMTRRTTRGAPAVPRDPTLCR